MLKILLILTFFISFLNAQTITIAVAANVSYAIEDLKKEFNKLYPNIDVKTTLGSSGKLTAQIKHGAPYQLFMSANMKYPQSLYEEKIALESPKVYALGSLAILSHKSRDLTHGIYTLESDKISKIAIANPKTAPYGIAAKEALEHIGIYNKIKPKFVYGESISQTLSYAVTAADIGIVAKSSLYSKHMKQYKKNRNWVTVDTKIYTPIKQGVVILDKSREVKAFYNFILSNKADDIFKRYGYLRP
jgi:molybdate transport system substrate-binding protein